MVSEIGHFTMLLNWQPGIASISQVENSYADEAEYSYPNDLSVSAL